MAQRSAQRIILVVEDEDIIIRQFQLAFEDQSEFLLDVATKLPEAISKIKRIFYDLILLDMQLDGNKVAGMEVLREINRQRIMARASQQVSVDSRVVIMSGSINLSDIMQEANTLGVFCFIDKPVPFTVDFVRYIINWFGMPLLPPKS